MPIKHILYSSILFVLLNTSLLYAQYITPNGEFISDSIKIGEPVKFALSYRHHKEIEIIFPDSSFLFTPFEYINKEYFPTKTKDSISTDSTIYTLRTFDLQKSLELSLPIFIIEQGDTIRLNSNNDKINIIQYFETIPDSLKLKTNTNYVPVYFQKNYPYIIAAVLISIVFLILFYFMLGKTILKNYKLYIMYNNHRAFLINFERLQKDMLKNPDLQTMEKVLGEWKTYLTKLEQKPINTYTTREIISLFNKDELKENLQEIDRSIYSGNIFGDPSKALGVLRKFSNKRYKKRRKELRNAKR